MIALAQSCCVPKCFGSHVNQDVAAHVAQQRCQLAQLTPLLGVWFVLGSLLHSSDYTIGKALRTRPRANFAPGALSDACQDDRVGCLSDFNSLDERWPGAGERPQSPVHIVGGKAGSCDDIGDVQPKGICVIEVAYGFFEHRQISGFPR
jgi:hypothetical protein